MNLFNSAGNVPSMPRTPQIPEIPQMPNPFGFGLSTITDFIGLTEPTTPNPQQTRPRSSTMSDQANNHHQQYHQTPSSGTQQQYGREGSFEHLHMSENHYSSVPSSDRNLFAVPFSTATSNQFHIPPSFASPQKLHVPYKENIPADSASYFIPISTAPLSSTQPPFAMPGLPSYVAPTTETPPCPPPPPTLILPVPTTTSSSELFYDPTRRSVASPNASGVQIDLINLRQKLTRDIQNNMESVAKQQSKIQDLQCRADAVEKEYSHLKCDLADLKRKHRDQEEKLKEIDSLVKSAMTMSSFDSPSSLRLEMSEIEAENEMDPTIRVVALD